MSIVLKEHDRNGDWRCYTVESSLISLPSIDELFELIDAFPKTLKDDRRSLVKLGDIDGCKVVAKQARDKNNRKWTRFLTLFSAGEARKTFVTLQEFKKKGIESLLPICFLEKKSYGMVVDSWLLYQYREGEESNQIHLARIVELLQTLHKNGYRHEDPNSGNFLIDNEGVMFLIDCKGKPRSGRYSDYYDFMLLVNNQFTAEDVDALTNMDKQSLAYRLAKVYKTYINLRSAWKKMIGRKRSKKDRI